jgi:hypothetical protein
MDRAGGNERERLRDGALRNDDRRIFLKQRRKSSGRANAGAAVAFPARAPRKIQQQNERKK